MEPIAKSDYWGAGEGTTSHFKGRCLFLAGDQSHLCVPCNPNHPLSTTAFSVELVWLCTAFKNPFYLLFEMILSLKVCFNFGYLYDCMAAWVICTWEQVPAGARRCCVPWRWSCRQLCHLTWVLWTELSFEGKTLNCWVISPAPVWNGSRSYPLEDVHLIFTESEVMEHSAIVWDFSEACRAVLEVS